MTISTVVINSPTDFTAVAVILGCASGIGYLAGRGRTILRYQRRAAADKVAAMIAEQGAMIDQLVGAARQHHQAIGRLTDDIDAIFERRSLTRPAPRHRTPVDAAARTAEHRAITTAADPVPLRERIAAGDPALEWTTDQTIRVVARRTRAGIAPLPTVAGGRR